MSRLELIDQGVIFRNPLPGHQVLNCFYPNIHIISAQEWLCVLRIGNALYSRDGINELFRTVDAGKTWQRQGPFYTRERGAVFYNYFDAYHTRLADGTLIMRLSRVNHSDAGKLLLNEATGGMLAWEFCVVRSQDNGRTWSAPIRAQLLEPFDASLVPTATGPIIELADGSWFQAVETWKSYDNAGPYDLNTYGMFSTDGGRTWTQRVTVASGARSNRSFSHSRPIKLADGRLFCSLWTADAELTQFYELHAVRSTDATARTWTEPEPIGVFGQTNWPVELPGNRMVLIYSHRERTEQPGIKVILSEDGGRSWVVERQVTVWDAYGREALGVPRTATYPSSHDVIAYGAPQLTRLNETEVVGSFWCTQGPDTHCRWCRLGVV